MKKYIAIHSNGVKAGKSTMAKALSSLIPGSAVLPFSSPLKNMARARGFTNSKTPEDRQILFDIDKEQKSANGQLVFFNMWKKEAESMEPQIIILDDLRYPYEFSYLVQHDTMFIHINSPWAEKIDHESEHGIDLSEFGRHFHFVAFHEKNEEVLNQKAKTLADTFLKGKYK